MKWLGKVRFKFLKEQKGISLFEVLVAVAILGFIGVAFLTALSTTSKSTGLYEQRVTAASLAQSQIEEIKAMDYNPSGNYTVVVDLPSGYIMSISTAEVETDKQEVTVKVARGEHYLFELPTIKTNW